MRTKADIAAEDVMGKLNCAQSTISMFAEDYGLDKTTAIRMGAGLGGGCHYGEACGVVAAGAAVVGLKYGNKEHDPETYAFCRLKTREFVEEFVARNGALTCRDLLGIDMAEPDGRDRAAAAGLFQTKCKDLVRSGVGILEEQGY